MTLMRFGIWGCCEFSFFMPQVDTLKWLLHSAYHTLALHIPRPPLNHFSMRFVLIQSIVHTCNPMIGGFLPVFYVILLFACHTRSNDISLGECEGFSFTYLTLTLNRKSFVTHLRRHSSGCFNSRFKSWSGTH